MSSLFTPGLLLSPRKRVVKHRDLPVAGRVLVAVGDVVQPDSIVAEAEREGELLIVRVGEILGLSPGDVVQRLVVKIGDKVKAGDLIAELRGLWGLFRTTVQAPISGTVDLISTATGHIGIRGPATRLTLSAYLEGIVERVEEGRGVVIATDATIIQGIFGVGGERWGVITLLTCASNEVVTPEHIPDDCVGRILIGGMSPQLETLRVAASRGAVGFITTSIDDATLRDYVGYDIGIALTGDEDLSMTLIITEGFGAIPLNSRLLELLRLAEGKRGSINGATQVRAGALRPELITSPTDNVNDLSPSSANSTKQSTNSLDDKNGLSLGSKVRMIRVPFFGMRGTVVELPHELARIETGALARVAKIHVEQTGEEVIVPRANLEVA